MSERWKPEKGDQYYFMDSVGDIVCDPRGDFTWIRERIAMGNYFKTEAEAQAAAEKVKALLLSLHESTQDTTQDELLPNWCAVGGVVYSKDEKDYAKVQSLCTIGVNLLFLKENKHYQRNCAYIKHECVQARLRPYNADEMRGLIGKVVGNEHGNMFLVTAFVTDDEGEVCVDGIVYNADDLLECYTINGKPCGVLEHLEDGEWVE